MREYFWEDKIYYRTNEFRSEKITLVFVHGVSGSSSAWLPYEKIFNDKYQNKYNILTYDIRGHGMSKKYPNYADYEIEKFAEDLHALITHLNIEKFVLISNSFGALIHLLYLRLYRESVMANIFTSPEIYLVKGLLEKILRPILALLRVVLKIIPFNPKPRGHVDYSRYLNSTDWEIGRNWADMKNTGFHPHFYSLKQSLVRGQEYLLDKINVPTLIIHGERDSMVPIENAIAISKKIKNSEFLMIENVDHNTVHNAVAEMSEAIESFLEKNLL